MHNGMLELDAEKMSKSLGNIRSLAGALDHAGAEALVLFFCNGHYRQPMAYSEELLDEAARRAERIRDTARRLTDGPTPADMAPLLERFLAALADDFNTPAALAAVAEWVREANRREGPVGGEDLREMLDVLGVASLMARRRRRAARRRPRGARRRARGGAPGARLRARRRAARRAAPPGLGGPRRAGGAPARPAA